MGFDKLKGKDNRPDKLNYVLKGNPQPKLSVSTFNALLILCTFTKNPIYGKHKTIFRAIR